jgi:alpha-glucosidase
MKCLLFILTLSAVCWNSFSQSHQMKSPDGKIELSVAIGQKIEWSLKYGQSELVKKGHFSFIVNQNQDLAAKPALKKKAQTAHVENIDCSVPTKFNHLQVSYNKLVIDFKNQFSVEFRLYNDGFAYRPITSLKPSLTVVNEDIAIEFAQDCRILFPEEQSLISHYERLYKDTALNALVENSFASLPLLVQTKEGINMVVTDADLYDYPCLFLEKSGENRLISKFPKVIADLVDNPQGPDRNEVIKKEEPFIAKTTGTRTFPWRAFAIAAHDKNLLENQLVYNLSRTGKYGFEWVKPGNVAWDWWNANNIYGVDFKSGINTQTYKYYIDFASDFNIDYIILDEGWSKTTTNLYESNPDIDLPDLMAYAKSKNVGIILWVLWKPFYTDIDKILEKFSQWGAVGIKVDFMQRADQQMVNIYETIARKAAEKKMLVDFHGAFKPSGLRRAFPNVLTYEGVQGLEQLKWSKNITPGHNLTLPFIRMVAGPMDYTPGAMVNKQLENYSISFNQPMSMGTRAHQAALYIAFESPLQMLADNPSNYRKDKDYTRFISRIPTVWDKTVALEAKIGKYLVIARKKGENWYLGALTDWEDREFEIDLAFLEHENYKVEILQDGVNANTHAEDYKLYNTAMSKNSKLKIKMARGGGFVAVFKPEK